MPLVYKAIPSHDSRNRQNQTEAGNFKIACFCMVLFFLIKNKSNQTTPYHAVPKAYG